VTGIVGNLGLVVALIAALASSVAALKKWLPAARILLIG